MRASSLLLVLGGIGCVVGDLPAKQSSNVVYGDDDRRDVYAHTDPALQTLARRSIVALMRSGSVDESNPARVRFYSTTLRASHSLCSSERFLDDPTAAFCSGTLISDDIVLTAGHCLDDQAACSNTRFVFGYYFDGPGTLHTVTSQDVFRCGRLLSRVLTTTGGRSIDYALVRLDRSATPRFSPARVTRTAAALPSGQPVTVIGFGSGVPAKIDSGGRVRDPRSSSLDYFVATTDTFGGNSGSGVFSGTTRELVGILVRGEDDYVASGGCNVVNRCSSTGCRGEDCTYARRAIDDLCRLAPTAVPCVPEPVCGDGRCDPSEDGVCTADCFTEVDTGVEVDTGFPVPEDTGFPIPEDTGSYQPEDTGFPVPEDTGFPIPYDTGTAPRDTGTVIRPDATAYDVPSPRDAPLVSDTGAQPDEDAGTEGEVVWFAYDHHGCDASPHGRRGGAGFGLLAFAFGLLSRRRRG